MRFRPSSSVRDLCGGFKGLVYYQSALYAYLKSLGTLLTLDANSEANAGSIDSVLDTKDRPLDCGAAFADFSARIFFAMAETLLFLRLQCCKRCCGFQI